jgi:hypothetical protein
VSCSTARGELQHGVSRSAERWEAARSA